MADDDPKTPPVEATPPTPSPETPPESPPESPEHTPDWRDKEIATKHRQLKEREQMLAEIRAENERLKQLAEAAARGNQPPPSEPRPPSAPADSGNLEQRARQMAAEMMAKEQAGNLDASLRNEYSSEYDGIIRNFSSLEGSFETMFNDIMATDDPAYVTATLGKNPAEIQRIRDLPTAKRQAALIKIAMEKAKPLAAADAKPPPRRPSSAPPPPAGNPPGGTAVRVESENLYDEAYNFANYYAGNDQIATERERDEAWFARRQEQKRNSVGRPWSPGGKSGTGGRPG